MAIRHASIYDPPSPVDGHRVLATRYWPRGVRREAVDEYVPALAPSRELLRAYRRGAIDWPAFRVRYLDEMASPQARAALDRLRATARESNVTVICVCRDAERCHRSLLAELLA